jgi:hypothetical protein
MHHRVIGLWLSSCRANSYVIFALNTQIHSALCNTISSTSASFEIVGYFLDAMYRNYCRLDFIQSILICQACWRSQTSQCRCSRGTTCFPPIPWWLGSCHSFWLIPWVWNKVMSVMKPVAHPLHWLLLVSWFLVGLLWRTPCHVCVISLFEMTNIPHCQCVGYPVLWYSVPGGCVPMRAQTHTFLSLADCPGTTFAAHSFRTWLRASFSGLSLSMRRCCFTSQSCTPMTNTLAAPFRKKLGYRQVPDGLTAWQLLQIPVEGCSLVDTV